MVALGAIGGSPSASVCSSPGRAPACPRRSALCLLVPCVSVGLDAGPGISVSVEQPRPDAQAAHPERLHTRAAPTGHPERCGHQQRRRSQHAASAL